MAGKDEREEPLASRRHFPTANERRLDALVAQWVGEDAAPGVLGKFHRQPRKIGDCVDRFLCRIHQEDEVLLEKLRENWQTLAGPENSRMLHPHAIQGGTLLIAAMNSTYVYVFRQSEVKDILLGHLREFSEGRIQDCKVIVAGRR